MLISDHPHLFETGGENYHTEFTAWDYERGHEGDPWKTRPDTIVARARRPWAARRCRTTTRAATSAARPTSPARAPWPPPPRWLDDNAGYHDRFLLFVDEFDPHEPFDTPDEYALMYDDTWDGPHLIWPPYVSGAIAAGVLTERQARQLRACYGGKLTMIDAWFGRIVDAIERHGMWDDTAVIVCTDHGHYLGEKDIWGKPNVPIYETARPHSADGLVAGRRGRHNAARSRPTSTSSPRSRTCSARP